MKYQVAGYGIDIARYRITRDGQVVPVEPKVFDLLVYLIRHRDRVVSREELFQTVWEGREVSDATLSNHVMSARKVLGDNGGLQDTIQTVRGRGYQFIAAVAEVADGVPAAGEADRPAGKAESLRRPWRLSLALGALLLPASLVAWNLFSPAPHPAPAAPPDRPYVVVVPFDVSENVPEKWKPFADDVPREVISNLEQISGLRVVKWTSAIAFKADKEAAHVREQIPAVRYMLDAWVGFSPDITALRVRAQLTDLAEGKVVWNDEFERRIGESDYFRMHQEIAQAVSLALKVTILRNEQLALLEFPTSNQQAYSPYVAGWEQMELFTSGSLHAAIDHFDEAIRLDPQYFAAYMAKAEAQRTLFGYFEPPIEMLEAVKATLNDALQIRRDSAAAYSSLGLTQVMAWQWEDAWKNLTRARELAGANVPDRLLATAELGLALYYAALDQPGKVKQALQRANGLDPLNTELADWGHWALFMVGETEAAKSWIEEKLAQHPTNTFLPSSAAVGAYVRGDTSLAVQFAEQGVQLERAPVGLILLAQAYGYDGQKDKVEPLLREARGAGVYACPYESAVAYLSIGENERAIELLYEAVDKRSNCLMFLHVDPRLEPIREDPRYADLLVRVGLDERTRASHLR